MCVAQVEIAASSSSQRLKSTTVYLVGLVNIDVFDATIMLCLQCLLV
jgi:hypothetical protein